MIEMDVEGFEAEGIPVILPLKSAGMGESPAAAELAVFDLDVDPGIGVLARALLQVEQEGDAEDEGHPCDVCPARGIGQMVGAAAIAVVRQLAPVAPDVG